MPHTIAVINSNEDTVEMLRLALEQAGFNTVTAHIADIKRGRTDFPEFLRKHNPTVVLYDLAVPYKDNWTFLKTLMEMDSVKNRKFLLTTTNKGLLHKLAGEEIEAFEISEKPYDIESVVEKAKQLAA